MLCACLCGKGQPGMHSNTNTELTPSTMFFIHVDFTAFTSTTHHTRIIHTQCVPCVQCAYYIYMSKMCIWYVMHIPFIYYF